MQANHLQVNNEQRMGITITDEMKHEFESFWENHKRQPLVGRDTIIRSICPQVQPSSISHRRRGRVSIAEIAESSPSRCMACTPSSSRCCWS